MLSWSSFLKRLKTFTDVLRDVHPQNGANGSQENWLQTTETTYRWTQYADNTNSPPTTFVQGPQWRWLLVTKDQKFTILPADKGKMHSGS